MNSFGKRFKVTLFGESHSEYLGVLIDGVVPGIELTQEDIIKETLRRKSGYIGTTSRTEEDIPKIISGLCNGYTDGTPIVISFTNKNCRSADYDRFREVPRPSHADYTSSIKYNFFNDMCGSGQFSGRMTLPLVAAGVVAKKMIPEISISAQLVEAGGISLDTEESRVVFNKLLEETTAEGDSLGGVVSCTCLSVPIAIGSPFFDSLESQFSHLLFSIPGVRGVEFGDGFRAAAMKGSEHNDPYIDIEGHTSKNGAGGINGGLSNGNPITFRVAFRPASSISKVQRSFNFVEERMEEFAIQGRHDVCFALRTPVVVESVAAIVLCDNIIDIL